MIVKLRRKPWMIVQLCKGPLDDGYIVLAALNDCEIVQETLDDC